MATERVHAIAKTLVVEGCREVESVAGVIDLVDGGDLPLLIRGDVSIGAVVRNAGAVVVDGKVEGPAIYRAKYRQVVL